MRNKQRYDEYWYDVIRPKALERANYRCQKCGAKHRSIGYRDAQGNWVECDQFMIEWCKQNGIKVKKMFLQVSHKEHDTSKNEPNDLQVLCPRDHLIYDKQTRQISRHIQFKFPPTNK